MLEFTLKQVLEDNLDIPDEYYLYVVRDGSAVFYVGMTVACTLPGRIHNHVYGGYGSGPSRLGRAVRANVPESLEWQVQFFDPQEVAAALLANRPYMAAKDKAEAGESVLIQRLRPCLNVTYNTRNTRRLPERYKEPRDFIKVDLETTVSDFIPFE